MAQIFPAEQARRKTGAELALADIFAAAKLPGDLRVKAVRTAAFSEFAANGLPHRRIETWKYTDLRNLMRDAKPLAPPPDATAKASAKNAGALFPQTGGRRLLFVDGAFVPQLSDLSDMPAGLEICSMAEALASGDPLTARHLGKLLPVRDPALSLNTALMGDGVVIHVAANTIIAEPLILVFVTTSGSGTATFMRSLVVVEPGAQLTLIESYEGPDKSDYQVNAAVEISVGEGSRVDHVKVTCEGSAALHVASVLAALDARAQFNDCYYTIGGSLVRNQVFVRIAGEGASASISGASLLSGKQHADSTLSIDHVAGGCQSREVFKSVLDDEARAVFQGRIKVQPHAQKTDARMMSRALLLSDTAEASSKPELEIFADDVQCGHGTTTGALDPELKFYLMARGVPEKDAEALLIQAFIGEVVDGIDHENIRDVLTEATAGWLRERK